MKLALGAAALAGLLVLAGLAGCGRTESKQAHCSSLVGEEHDACVAELRHEEELGDSESAQSEGLPEGMPVEEEPGGPLGDVGTIANHEKGMTFRDHFKIGPLLYPDEGTPPEEVLEACNLQYQGVIEKSVFARGEMSVSYAEGSFPEFLGIDAEGIVQGTDTAIDVVAYQMNGEWLCRQEELASTRYEIQPGETWNMPIWYIAEDILNNAQPRVPLEVLNGWHFQFVGPLMSGTRTYSGPGVGECYGYDELYLYNRSGSCDGG